jgi:hypothetical protein
MNDLGSSPARRITRAILGGGNAKRLDSLPEYIRLGNNEDRFLSGFRLWRPPSVLS